MMRAQFDAERGATVSGHGPAMNCRASVVPPLNRRQLFGWAAGGAAQLDRVASKIAEIQACRMGALPHFIRESINAPDGKKGADRNPRPQCIPRRSA